MRHLSLAWYVLPVYLALLLYASFYPFLNWNPAGLDATWVLQQPLPRIHWSSSDNILNWLGYAPLGFLLTLALLRSQHRSTWLAVLAFVLAATALASAWSWGIETAQLMLPQRVSSKLDWLTNTAGAATGAALAALLERLGLLGHWHTWRGRWLRSGAQAETALLLAWPFALLTPSAVPLGLGQVGERLLLALRQWGLPLENWLGASATGPLASLSPVAAVLCTALGLLLPVLLAFLAVNTTTQRALALLAVVFGGWFALSVSSALSFGPLHTWAWWSVGVQAAFVMACLAGLACLVLRRRAIALLALLALVWMLAVLNQVSSSAYFWQTLQTWEQGRFIHFNGVAQWINWLWPYLALLVLLRRVLEVSRGPASSEISVISKIGP